MTPHYPLSFEIEGFKSSASVRLAAMFKVSAKTEPSGVLNLSVMMCLHPFFELIFQPAESHCGMCEVSALV
jgi:hypothetical protein